MKPIIFSLLLAILSTGSAMAEDYFRADTDPHVYRLVNSLDIHHLRRAQNSIFEGQPEVAWREATFVLHRIPNYPKALELLGQAAQRLNRENVALDYFERAVAQNPKVGDIHYIYALYLHRLKQTAKAEKEYKTALELSPNLAAAHYNYGLLLFNKGDKTAANEHAQQAYAGGYPLPGLRDLLQKAGAWKETTSSPDTAEKPKQPDQK